MAVSLTGDVTVTPLTKVVSSTDGGTTWHTDAQPKVIRTAVSWTAVLPDGTFLAEALDRSGHPIGPGSSHQRGLFRSIGPDWTRLTRAHPQLPSGESEALGSLQELVATAMDGEDMALYASSANRAGLVMSDDGGTTWTAVRDR